MNKIILVLLLALLGLEGFKFYNQLVWFAHLEEMNCTLINQTGGYCQQSNPLPGDNPGSRMK